MYGIMTLFYDQSFTLSENASTHVASVFYFSPMIFSAAPKMANCACS